MQQHSIDCSVFHRQISSQLYISLPADKEQSTERRIASAADAADAADAANAADATAASTASSTAAAAADAAAAAAESIITHLAILACGAVHMPRY